MERGAVVLTKFPFTDLSSAKRRPGVIISGKKSNTDDVIVAFISSVVPTNTEETDYVFTSVHPGYHLSGLKKDSVIKLNKLATLNISVIAGEIGKIDDKTLKELDLRLKLALGLK